MDFVDIIYKGDGSIVSAFWENFNLS
jgi:hypothetical protein